MSKRMMVIAACAWIPARALAEGDGATMKAILVHEVGGTQQLRLEDAPRPTPAADEMLVRVRAAGVNPIDAYLRAGQVRWRGKLPLIPGYDVAGVVVQVGPAVKRFNVGDELFAMLARDRAGGYAQYAVVKESEAAPRPRNMTFEEAAGVPLTALTAWLALVETAKLQRGQTVLVHGGSGGVGSMAIQIARARGAEVIATASGKNQDLLRKLGATRAVDYEKQRFEDVAKGVDVVLDPVGGETAARSWGCLKRGGILVSLVGGADPAAAAAHGVRAANISVQANGDQLRQIATLIDAKQLVAAPTQVMPLADAARAHEKVETRHTRGKIVLTVE